MILNIVYLVVGLLAGFIVKNEICIRERQKRVISQRKIISKVVEPYDNTLNIIKEFNESFLIIQKNNTKKNVG